MIPILYSKEETAFVSNGLGRLRDCISCVVSEERNGIYECDFEYPVDGVNYDKIQLGCIIAVEHDESNDVQPFDIVSYSRPINGIVTFHCVHVSYRQTALTVTGSNINSLADAFTWLGTAEPENPFSYWTDKDSVGFVASADSIPHSVRSVLGGMEGSLLDSFGGEYEWDRWTVKLWDNRGSLRNFTIRYGVNLVGYEEEMDYTDSYTSVIPYWLGQDSSGNDLVIKGDRQDAGFPSFNDTGRCIPLDVTDRFSTDNGQPTKAQVEAEGLAYINANQPYLPAQTIKVDFVRLSDTPEYAHFAPLQKCRLCDSINVLFPMYNMEGQFKIVRTEYDVLREKYNTLELGGLSVTLSEALGISQDASYRLRISGGGGGGAVNDVKVNGSSVVDQDGVAAVTVPTQVSDLTNDSGYITGYTETDPVFSASAAAGISSSDITIWNGKSDFSGNYNDLTNKPTIPSTAADVGAVPTTRTVNGKALSSDITLTASDVSALPDSTAIPTKLTDLTNDMDVSDFPNDANYSSVSVARKTTTGTNIADITIDGTTTQLYAPSGGGGGTTDYDDLTDKPSINSVTLSGNQTTSDLSIHEIPTGGSSGQVLAKSSGTDYDVGWITPSGGGIDIQTKDGSGSKSISANAAGYIDVALTAPSGYTLIGVTQITSNASAAIPISWSVSNNSTIRVYYRNVTGSSVSQTVWLTGLYIKSL